MEITTYTYNEKTLLHFGDTKKMGPTRQCTRYYILEFTFKKALQLIGRKIEIFLVTHIQRYLQLDDFELERLRDNIFLVLIHVFLVNK